MCIVILVVYSDDLVISGVLQEQGENYLMLEVTIGT